MSQAKSSESKREQYLLMLFPTAIILAIYSVLFAPSLQREKAELETEYSREKLKAVSQNNADMSKQALSNAQAGLKRLRDRVQSSKLQIRELSQSWRSRQSRLETLEKITEFMGDFNLSIVSQGQDEGLVVSAYQLELFKMMNEQFPLNPVEFWNVEVKGAYFEVSEFLAAVNGLEKAFIPVAVTMKPEPGTSTEKTWLIVFAI